MILCVYLSSAQTKPDRNATLYEALLYFTDSCNIKLAFDADLVKTINITDDFKKYPCKDALSLLLKGTSLWFVKTNDVFIVKPLKEIPEEQRPKTESAPAETEPPFLWVSGQVRQQNTKESLPFSNIQIEGTQTGTMTNNDGYFTLRVNPLDTTTLMVSHIGYYSKKYKLKPSGVGKLFIIELQPQSFIVETVDVKVAENVGLVKFGSNQGNMTFNVSKASGMPSLHPLDIIMPLQLLPGIDGTTETSSGLRIRKSSPDKTLILYDGYPVYGIDHLYGKLSSFNQKTINDVQVRKGINHAKFEGAPGGVIEITGKSGNMKKLSVDAGFDLMNANVVAQAPLGKNASLIASFRRSYSDILQTGFYQKQFKNIRYDIENSSHMSPSFLDADPEISNQVFNDYTAKLTFSPSLKSKVSFSAFGGNDEVSFENITNGGEVRETSEKSNSGMSLRYVMHWAPKYNTNILLGHSSHSSMFLHRDKFVYNRSVIAVNSNVVGVEQEQVNDITDFSFEINNSVQILKNYKLDFGVKTNNISTNFGDLYYQNVGAKSIVQANNELQNKGSITSLYVQNAISFNKHRHFDLGLRSSYFSITSQVFFEPRISLDYEILRGLSFKASYGKYTQFNNRIILTDQSDYNYLWSLSDENNPVVESDQLCTGLLIAPGAGFTFDIEIYRKETSNLTAIQNITLYNLQTDAKQRRKLFHYKNITRGIDFFLKKHFGPLQLWASYTLSESTDQSEILPNNPEYPAIDHQPHELKLFGTFRYRGWSLSSSWIYGSGKRWDRAANLAVKDSGYKKNSEVLPPYHRMDIGLEKISKIGGMEVSAAFKIFNVYNRENIMTRQNFVNNVPSLSADERSYLQINEVTGGGFAYNLVFNFHF